MVTSQERLKILQMLEHGKISAEEAAKLLEAAAQHEESRAVAASTGRWLCIRVIDMGDKTAVNLRFPLKIAEWALRFVPGKYLELGGIGKEDLAQAIEQAASAGKVQLVDVHDGKQHVRIAIE